MAQIAPKTLTSANSVLLWKAKGYTDQFVQAQGYKTDSAFDFSGATIGETVMGVDGIQSGAYIQHEHQLTITFEANSPTRAHFAKMYERMTEQMETFPFEFQVDIPSLGIRRIAKGFMINLAGFSAKKRMDAGSFTFNLGVVTEEEIS
ncbi:hypothetical protein [Neisseria lactamica]|uniref:hypothetical protein n=1 Tax=Neisseria lactamica TaxID=486 RepID=UPI0003612441|nr:hypothetical protein [Neisseria lactamica]